ncbi:MAG: alpha-hydroxy-acid oxidizing protein, partial [Achromobacter mucicolens]
GARCVFVGRPFNYAATVAGQRGVAHAIALIAEEVKRDMGLLGVVDVRELNAEFLQRASRLAGRGA